MKIYSILDHASIIIAQIISLPTFLASNNITCFIYIYYSILYTFLKKQSLSYFVYIIDVCKNLYIYCILTFAKN